MDEGTGECSGGSVKMGKLLQRPNTNFSGDGGYVFRFLANLLPPPPIATGKVWLGKMVCVRWWWVDQRRNESA